MSDGGYSRLEKDFLGNERMVHYDGSGNMIGASDVVREPDGTIRIPNEAGTTTAAASASPTDPTAHIPKDAGVAMRNKQSMPASRLITYVFAAFIGSMLLTLAVVTVFAGRGGSRSNSGDTAIQTPAIQQPGPSYGDGSVPRRDTEPAPAPDNYPSDPKPRNDEDDTNVKPYDQTAPDMNSGDDNRPKIDDPNSVTKSDNGDKKPKANPDDPIDLRGDGEEQKSPTKTDPNDIH